jgi:hypothetical protein
LDISKNATFLNQDRLLDFMEQSKGKLKILALAGVLAPIFYVAALIIGNILDPTYSQIGKTVSELIQRGAPNRDLLNVLFVVYNILIIPFAAGLFYGLKKDWARNVVAASLIVIAVLGVVWTLFLPLDAGGKSVSLTGMLHLAVGGLVVPFTFIYQLTFWQYSRKDHAWRSYGVMSATLFFGYTHFRFNHRCLR